MLVHIHGAEERTCDGCGRSSVIFDVQGKRPECGLSLCQKCFRDFTNTLVQVAARIKGDLDEARI
jgi:NMD protein affecting ribosome stability and mRNA decay